MNVFRLGLKPRLYSGFGVLVLLGLALAGFAAWELSGIRSDVQKSSGINDNTIRALEVANRIEIFRRANLRFIVDADEQAPKEAAAAESEAIELLKAAAVATPTEERRTIYNNLRSGVESMGSQRGTLVTLGKQMQADRAKLFTGGDALTAAAEKLVAAHGNISDPKVAALLGPIEAGILLVRVANWRFLATRDAKGPATFKTSAEHAATAIAALEKSELPDNVHALIGPVKTALAAYVSSFDALAAGMLKSDELYWKAMVPQTVDMLAKVGKVEASLKQLSDTTNTETLATVDTTMLAQEIIAGLALVFGVRSPSSSDAASSSRLPA